MPEAQYEVRVDDVAIAVIMPDEAFSVIRWDQLEQVRIETNDTGPFGTDMWWVLTGDDRHVSIPSGAEGESIFMDAIQKLEGFDNEAVIQASMSTDNAEFVCWTRSE